MELNSVNSKLEDEHGLVTKLQRQIKEHQGRLGEMEEELESERQARQKVEKQRAELARELEEMADRAEEGTGMTSAQIEMNKKREAEMAKLRRDLEESNIQHETIVQSLRKKNADSISELGDQVDQLNKVKAKLDKEKSQMKVKFRTGFSNSFLIAFKTTEKTKFAPQFPSGLFSVLQENWSLKSIEQRINSYCFSD